jgi:hypothetical protein
MRANCKRNSLSRILNQHDLFQYSRPAAEISGPADMDFCRFGGV